MTAAIAAQPAGLAASAALSVSGTMSGIPGWVVNPALLSDSETNQWLTIADMRAAVLALQQRTAITCQDIAVAFLPVLSNNGQVATLYFQGYTFLPAGFSDTNGAGCLLTISDVDGNTYKQRIIIAAAATGNPVTLQLAGTNLLPTSNYTFELDASITNGTLTCVKSVIHTVANTASVCPVLTVTPVITTANVYFTPPITGNVTYTLTLLDATGNTVLASQAFTPNTSGVISASFNALTASTTYKLRVTTVVATLPAAICPLVAFTTTATPAQ
jgi:hypothetical protein